MGTTWGSRRATEICEPDDIPGWPIITAALHFEEGSEAIDNVEWGEKVRAACPKLDLISPGSRMTISSRCRLVVPKTDDEETDF